MLATSTSFHFTFLFSQLFRWLMGCWSSASGAPLVSNLAISPPPLGSVWYNPLKVKKYFWYFNCSDIIIIFNMSLERFQKDIPQNGANYNTLTTKNHLDFPGVPFVLLKIRVHLHLRSPSQPLRSAQEPTTHCFRTLQCSNQKVLWI